MNKSESSSSSTSENSLYKIAQNTTKQGNFPNNNKSPKVPAGGANNRSLSPMQECSTNYQANTKHLTKIEQEELYSRLYKQSFERDQKLNEMRKKNILEKEEEENQNLTFKPKISEYKSHNELISDKNKSGNIRGTSDTNRLYDDAKRLKERENKIKKMKEIVLQEECPFRPELSPNSRVIAQNKNRSPIHNKLYVLAATNAKKKEEFIKEEFEAEHPFKPTISPNSLKYGHKHQHKDQKEFVQYLANERKLQEEKLANLRIKENANVDPKTGQKLFHPQIIHNKYYWNAKNKDDIKSGVSMDPNLLIVKEMVKKPEMNLSQEFIEYFQELFEILDNNHDGFISRSSIDLSKLDSRVLDVISEVLNHIDKNQNAFQFNDFLEICCKYNVPDRIAEVIKLIFQIKIHK